jgi:acetate kinase
MTDHILVINAGSSSLKFEVFEIAAGGGLKRRLKGKVDGIATRPRFVAQDGAGTAAIDETFDPKKIRTLPDAVAVLRDRLRAYFTGVMPWAVGHRVVHGGPVYAAPVLVDEDVVENLRRLIPLAPLHQPSNLAVIEALIARAPDIPQVACFDTAFHRGHPEVADRYAIPDALYAEGVRRYGFHGLSYEYIASRLPDLAPEIAHGRVVVAHLGSGASMCALVNGKSIESTMGFSALDGLAMGTRCGQIDPGVLLYLLSEKGMKPKDMEHFLYHDCGLKGLSGLSSDVRDLLGGCNQQGKFAVEFFNYRVAMQAGGLTAAMGGIDGFVFTAGIGENAAAVREDIGRRLGWLGIDIDPDANAKGVGRISASDSRIPCYVIPTDEELMIARHTLATLRERRSLL